MASLRPLVIIAGFVQQSLIDYIPPFHAPWVGYIGGSPMPFRDALHPSYVDIRGVPDPLPQYAAGDVTIGPPTGTWKTVAAASPYGHTRVIDAPFCANDDSAEDVTTGHGGIRDLQIMA